MYHAGKQLPIIITGHPSGAVELEPAILACPHTQQARVDLWAEDEHIVSSRGARYKVKNDVDKLGSQETHELAIAPKTLASC